MTDVMNNVDSPENHVHQNSTTATSQKNKGSRNFGSIQLGIDPNTLVSHPNEVNNPTWINLSHRNSVQKLQGQGPGQVGLSPILTKRGLSTKRRRGINVDVKKIRSSSIVQSIPVTGISMDPNSSTKIELNSEVKEGELGDEQQSEPMSRFEIFKEKLSLIINNYIISAIHFFLVVIVIFGYDVHFLITNNKYDVYLDCIFYLSFIFLLFMLFGYCICKENYVLSLMFFLDILSLVAIFLQTHNRLYLLARVIQPYNKSIKEMTHNQMQLMFLLEQIVQVMKITLILRVYHFILIIKRKIEIKKKMEEIQKALEKKEQRERKKFFHKNSIYVITETPRETKKPGGSSLGMPRVNTTSKKESSLVAMKTSGKSQGFVYQRQMSLGGSKPQKFGYFRKKTHIPTQNHTATLTSLNEGGVNTSQVPLNPIKTLNKHSYMVDEDISHDILSPLKKKINNFSKKFTQQFIPITPGPMTRNFNRSFKCNTTEKQEEEEEEENQEFALIQFTKNNIIKEKKKIELESESQISKIVVDSVSKKVLVIILLLLLVFPIFNENNYTSNDKKFSFSYVCELIDHHLTLKVSDPEISIEPFEELMAKLYEEHVSHWKDVIISITYKGDIIFINEDLEEDKYCDGEKGISASFSGRVKLYHSLKSFIRASVIIDLIRNFYLSGLIILISFFVLQDMKSNVLVPLENMISTVKIVAKDPVNFQSLEKLNQSFGTIEDKYSKSEKKRREDRYFIKIEIKTIQSAIIRISSLMAIGFGEAGGQIIKENMTSFEGLNPMILGKKINAVFGFCLIRNFQQINEALQERTILFVNDIASVVHSNVSKFGGVCNKNIGESFLLIWKFEEPSTQSNIVGFSKTINNTASQNMNFSRNINFTDNDRSQIDKKDTMGQCRGSSLKDSTIIKPLIINNSMTLVADSALMSFLSIIKKIRKSPVILKYENDQELKKLSKSNKFKLRMGFGLHVGWGIEGAIGSFYKIDCSYLSPNVNIAARLETATNIYGVDLLFSGEFYTLLSQPLQKISREIDCVTLKGSITPIKLFTVDTNKNIPKGREHQSMNPKSEKEKRIKNDIKREVIMSQYKKDKLSLYEVYLKRSKGMRNLLKSPKSDLFLRCFKKGYNLYIEGKWSQAYISLKQALYIDWSDGPTNCLIKYLEAHNKVAPITWEGYRALSSKF